MSKGHVYYISEDILPTTRHVVVQLFILSLQLHLRQQYEFVICFSFSIFRERFNYIASAGI